MTDRPRVTARRSTWRPSRSLWCVLAAACIGSGFGLVFGLTSLNRPLANAAVFYLLGALTGAALAVVALLLTRASRRGGG